MAVQRTFPILSTRDLGRLEAFYRDGFGAERVHASADDGRDVSIAMRIGASTVSIGLDDDLTGPPVGGSVAEPELMPWVERVAQVRDPEAFLLDLGDETSDQQR